MRETVTDFVSLAENEARKKYNLRKDSRDWQVRFAQADIRNHPDIEQHLAKLQYRPFDTRWTYYTGQSAGFHREARQDIMRHLHHTTNLAICVCRIVKSPTWQHALVTDKITEKCLNVSYIFRKISMRNRLAIFPLQDYIMHGIL